MLAIIDNYDSFTYNLVQYLGELGAESQVYRNDEINIAKLRKIKPKAILISPGPCTPNEAGISMQVTCKLAAEVPILGICLGLQSMVQAFGGKIVNANEIMHGKVSNVFYKQDELFENIDNPFKAARYHSLAADKSSLPNCFEIIAWTEYKNKKGGIDEIMGLRHRELPLMGVQFHPESLLTKQGKVILNNFINMIN